MLYKQNTLNFVAKLISDKLGIGVVFQKDLEVPCADVEHGIIYVCERYNYSDDDIADIIHEAGHIKYTDSYFYTLEEELKKLDALYSNASQLIGSIINSYEDIRMENLVCQDFMGARSFLNENLVSAWHSFNDYITIHGHYPQAWQNFERMLCWGLYYNPKYIDRQEYFLVKQMLTTAPDDKFIAMKDYMLKCKNAKEVAQWVKDHIQDIKHLLIPKTDSEKAMDKMMEEMQKMIDSMSDKEKNEFLKEAQEGIQKEGGSIPAGAKTIPITIGGQGQGESKSSGGRAIARVKCAGGLKEREIDDNSRFISKDALSSFVNSNLYKLVKTLSIFKDISTSRTISNLKRGHLDTNKLYKINTSSRLFKKTIETNRDYKDTVVYILCDESGSMRGSPSEITSKATALFMKGLDKVGVKTALFGFNCYFNVHKKADDKFNLTQCQDIDRHTNLDRFGGTENGYFLHKVYEDLKKRPEHNKILVCFADGCSADSSDIYPIDNVRYSDYPLKKVASKIESDKNIKLLSFGIGDDSVKDSYKHYKILNSAEELCPALIDLFKQIMPNKR